MPGRATTRAVLLLLLCLLSSVGARAEGCAPELQARLPLVLARNVPLVSLSAGGRPLTLILDTGADRTTLTAEAARRLGLEVRRAYARTTQGLGGTVASGEAWLRGLRAGGAPIADSLVVVAPITLPQLDGTQVDGLLGSDVLGDYDLELDMPRRQAALWRPAACPEPAPPWRGPYATVPAGRSLHGRLFFRARLDGDEIAALVDSGAQGSVLDRAAAARAGLSEEALARDPAATLHGVGGSVVSARVHRFGALRIGADELRSPVLVVAPLGLAEADLLLGMDFLLVRRVWLAYQARRVLVAPPA